MVRGACKISNYVLSVSKVFCLFLFALLLPRIFVTYVNTKSYNGIPLQKADFRLGLENITDDFFSKISKSGNLKCNAALITNQTGKDQLGRKNTDLLPKKGITIKKTLNPQDVPNNLNKNNLQNIQAIILDMQVTGIRNYESVNTLFKAIDTAFALDKKIIVLDRPNVMGPIVEGPLVKKSLKSKISASPIPLRYGMTLGELALFYNNSILKKPAKLHVVPMKNYARDNNFADNSVSEISENITNIFSCYGYSFLGLLKEVGPFYVGIGTKNAFQLLLLPDKIKFSQLQWQKLHKILCLYGVKSKFYTFFDKDKKIHYNGLKIKIENINYTPSFKLLIHVLNFFKNNGVELKFSQNFDQEAGTDKVRRFFENKISWKKLTKHVNKKLYKFYNIASAYFMYKPFPRIEYLN